ncbi:uncharacterized protein KY384_007430 [Bacidia gigantensis]|uniref:uncharacterized protein n=1 Tax=Bacidia gigantensis TaxID=2732470 RepID=UPI001D055443|nr:uncharacterized protein KY384_007430 [Bacidia gigantensis]KAG8528512.1 hypothetical protein KY384_007430 [Bacidia gigantensis]
MQNLPKITLDTTLAELYAHGANQKQIAVLLCAANSEIAPSSELSRNTKFLYQDSTFTSEPGHKNHDRYNRIQHSVAIKYLSLVPQHDAFAAGNMPAILLNLDKSKHSQEESERTVGVLNGSQRPTLLFYSHPKDIVVGRNGFDLLAAKMEFDDLEGVPLAVDLETHYFLNSKAALATSGLPSCTGFRGRWLKDHTERLLSTLSTQPLPIVLKNQQTFGGGGTFAITSPEELAEVKSTLNSQVLPKLLSQVNSSNAHLKPATMILSEMVTDPVGDWGLTFFVTKSGERIFLAVTQQIVDSSKAWIGSRISYSDQAQLKEKFMPIMHSIGAWLHRYSYYGPCGADILEIRSGRDVEANSTTLQIVDLNVRTSGSSVLALMSGHFSKQRGLHEATSFSVTVEVTRMRFIEYFQDRFRSGSWVIVSWYEDEEFGLSYGNVLIGASNVEQLEEEVAKLKDLASEIHF